MSKKIKYENKLENIYSLHHDTILHFKSLHDTSQKIDDLLEKDYEKQSKKMDRLLKLDFERDLKNLPKRELFSKILSISKTVNDLISSNISKNTFKESMISTAVSKYETCLLELINIILDKNPEIIWSKNTNLTVKELLRAGSKNKIKKIFIDEEIEKISREGKSNIFNWIDQKIKINFYNEIYFYENIREIFKRRDLYLHNNGKANIEYNKINKKIKVNTYINCEKNYISDSIQILLGACLYIIYRTCKKQNLSKEHKNFSPPYDTTYELLKSDLNLAAELYGKIILQNGENIKIDKNNEEYNYLIINTCIAMIRRNGKKSEIKDFINKINKNERSEVIEFAIDILRKKWVSAAKKLEKIDIEKENFLEWPLFEDFIKTEVFLKYYSKKFNEDFFHFQKDFETNKIPSSIK